MAEDEGGIALLLTEPQNTFEMREMEVTVYRGVEIQVLSDGIFIHQANCTMKILQNFNMLHAKPSENPLTTLEENNDWPLDGDTPNRQAVGSLAYLADATRPDVAFAVNLLAAQGSNQRHQRRYGLGAMNEEER